MFQVKEINLVKDGDKILANQVIDGINQQQTWNQCKQQADYEKRLTDIEKYNR